MWASTGHKEAWIRARKAEGIRSKYDLVAAAVRQLLDRDGILLPEDVHRVREDLNVSKIHMTRCFSRMGDVILVYNGPSYYRTRYESPATTWSMCVYNYQHQLDLMSYEDTLTKKGYERTEKVLPLPFEYSVSDTTIAHLEPCDTARWSMVYDYHMARKADQQEEQSEDCLQAGQAPDHLQ